MNLLNNIKILWGVIILLAGGLIGFIIYNKTLIADIVLLKEDLTKAKTEITLLKTTVDVLANSELYEFRRWRWTIEEKLLRANIITIEAGIIK